MKPGAYPLTRDAAEHARLAAQAAFWSADAAALFALAEIPAGAAVADLGCGTAHVALQLAQHVGPHGRVQALDNDARLVGAAAQDAADAAAVRFECGDAYATGWPAATLDAVHARFLAAPAGRIDALATEMLRLLRPGGVLMLQEPQADSWDIPAAGPAWPRLLEWIRAGFRQRGGDFDAGRGAAERLAAAGAIELRTRRVVHHLPPGHPYARLPLAFCDSLAATWRAAGLASAGEIAALRAEIAAALEQPQPATTFTLVQTWGRRPDKLSCVSAA